MNSIDKKAFMRIFQYALLRAASLMFAVVVAVWLTITVASKSGVLESEISGSKIGGWFSGIFQSGVRNPGEDFVPFQGTLAETIGLMVNGLTLNMGQTNVIYIYSGNSMLTDVRVIIMDFLARTLLLFGTANVILFFLSISVALLLYRNYGGFFDRLIVALSPLSSVPAWLYGLVLVVVAARVFNFFPAGIFDDWPDQLNWDAFVYLARRLALPVLAIFLSKIFQMIYLWRTFFLVHASEDYVEMGRAKGLKKNILDRNYVIRPALPNLMTSFAIMITGIWQEAIIIELFFGVAGIGHLFYNALRRAVTEMPLLIGLTVTFAYLLAISVFVLDIVYALVDPRVRIEGNREVSNPARPMTLREKLTSWMGIFARKKSRSVGEGHWSASSLGGERVPAKKLGFIANLRHLLSDLRPIAVEFFRYPSAVFGLLVVLAMVILSVYTLFAYPYKQVVALWRSEGDVWRDNPKSAAPSWTNLFRVNKLAETSILSTLDGTASKVVGETSNDMTPVTMEFNVDYDFDAFPTELILRIETQNAEKKVFLSGRWIMPDGREFPIGNFSTMSAIEEHHLLLEDAVTRKAPSQTRKMVWFSVENSDPPVTLKGRYTLKLDAILFEPGADIDAQMLLHGQLYGLAGTDSQRRDLLLPLLWGTPIALAFGLAGALLASLTTMTLAAVGAWFGGWVDALIQRLTEINMVLPAFPLLVLVYISISKNVWVILGLAVLLSMMNNAIKNYRATFIQIKESAYIEAARAYGSSDWRIIFYYLIPRILPVMVPQLVSLAPGLVFLEATLAYLNISDPTLPTWGKLIQESIMDGALNGTYYLVMEPVALLLLTGLALSMIGFALDRILNPRLRDA